MKKAALQIFLLIGALVASSQTDVLEYWMKYDASQTFNYRPRIWAAGVVPVAIAALQLSLAWLVLVRFPLSPSTGVLYLIAGLAAAFFFLLYMGWRIQPLPVDVVPLTQTISSRFGQMGGYVAVIGGIGLARSVIGARIEPRPVRG